MAAQVRKAERGDVDAIVEMARGFYAEASYPFEAAEVFGAVSTLLADSRRGAVWVVVDDGAAGGYGVLTWGHSLEYGGLDAFVDELWVAPALRGRGLGSEILDCMEAECRAKGAGALHLEVERGNPAAERMYLARGFSGNDRKLITKRFG